MVKTKRIVDNSEQLRSVKRERLNSETNQDDSYDQGYSERRVLRSQYLAIIDEIKDKIDDLVRPDSEKFHRIFSQVEELHKKVSKPREQVADAEALLDITNTLVTSVKSHSNGGITPSDFIFHLIRDFGQSNGGITHQDNDRNFISWKDIGQVVSPIFRKAHGCCTMLGPMNTEMKQRKTAVHKRHEKPTLTAWPEELDDTQVEEKTDTDNNMLMMFEVLRKKKHVGLESLILNRSSFAQTVENLFALSFLVKDGRAEIHLNADSSHIVSPKNAPASSSVMSGEVTYGHFVFRFDFADWKLMVDLVSMGEELMLHRSNSSPAKYDEAIPSTPIRKLSRNQGRVVRKDSVIEDSPQNDNGEIPKATAIGRCRRRLN